MEKDITNLELLEAINKGFATKQDFLDLTKSVDVLTNTTNDLTKSVDVLTNTTNDLTKSVDIVAKTTAKILETMTTKDDLNSVKLELRTEIAQVATDLESFKSETRENFEKLSKDIKENEVSVGAVVKDYHPRIIALEEKVFGHSALAEA